MRSPWENFDYSELACRCGQCDSDGTEIDQDFMDDIQALRTKAGFSFRVTSACRCSSHPIEAKKSGGPGVHSLNKAIDIAVDRKAAHRLLTLAMVSGKFTGIGINQKGRSRFIHLDQATDAEVSPRPTVWSY